MGDASSPSSPTSSANPKVLANDQSVVVCVGGTYVFYGRQVRGLFPTYSPQFADGWAGNGRRVVISLL
jgi:hypothetical protein